MGWMTFASDSLLNFELNFHSNILQGRSNAAGWDGWHMQHARIIIRTKFRLKYLKDRHYVGRRMWTGFVWLRIGACGGFL
jgi:hypothetical protein